jgi:16S rRNA (cytosine1402-N4)-methyltransferase
VINTHDKLAMNRHRPVLLTEVVAHFPFQLSGKYLYVDATLGGAGHAIAITEKFVAAEDKFTAHFLLNDLDKDAFKHYQLALKAEKIDSDRLAVEQSAINFAKLPARIEEILKVGDYNYLYTLADLGLSQNQLDQSGKGLSYRYSENLDMKLDESLGVSAADLLNALGRKELKNLFKNYGDIPHAERFVEFLVDSRKRKPMMTTSDLNRAILDYMFGQFLFNKEEYKESLNQLSKSKAEFPKQAIAFMAKVYQSLRIAVNLEYQNLEEYLEGLLSISPSVKVIHQIITFHSGEERVVNKALKHAELDFEIILPSSKEIETNPRSRSAKLYLIANSD